MIGLETSPMEGAQNWLPREGLKLGIMALAANGNDWWRYFCPRAATAIRAYQLSKRSHSFSAAELGLRCPSAMLPVARLLGGRTLLGRATSCRAHRDQKRGLTERTRNLPPETSHDFAQGDGDSEDDALGFVERIGLSLRYLYGPLSRPRRMPGCSPERGPKLAALEAETMVSLFFISSFPFETTALG
jgi:hypothetical protein